MMNGKRIFGHVVYIKLFLSVMIAVLLTACRTEAPSPISTPAHTTENVASPTAAPAGTSTVMVTATTEPPSDTPIAPTVAPTLDIPPTPTPLPVSNEVEFELVNQQWGATQSVFVEGNLAYLGLGTRLVVLEPDYVAVTNPPQLLRAGESEVLPGIVQAVLVRDGIAYVGAGTSIVTLDVTAPHSPQLLTELPLPGRVAHLALDGEVLVAGLQFSPADTHEEGQGMVATLRVQPAGHLELLDTANLPWAPQAMALAEGIVYVSQPAADTFYALSITDPANLQDPTPFSGVALTYSLQAHGRTLYMGGGRSNVSAWDVGDLAQPQLLWEVEAQPSGTLGMGVVQGFAPHEDQVYLAAVNLHGIEIGALILQAPEAFAGSSGELVSSRVVVQEGQLFYAGEGLAIYDLSSPDAPQLGKFTRPAIQDISAMGELGVFIAGNVPQSGEDSRLYTVSLPDLNFLGQYTDEPPCELCQSLFAELTVEANVTYVSAVEGGLRVIDLADPAVPRLLASLDGTDSSIGLRAGASAIAEGWAYVATSGVCDGRNLSVLDLRDPGNPQLANTIEVDGCIEQLAVSEGALYAAVHAADRPGGAVYLFERQDAELNLLGTLSFPDSVNSVQPFNDSLVVGTSAGLHVVDVADLSAPAVVTELPIPGGVTELAPAGDLVLLLVGRQGNNGQLYAIDLSEPAAPRPVGSYHLPSGGGSLAVAGDYILVGNSSMGLVVLRLNENDL